MLAFILQRRASKRQFDPIYEGIPSCSLAKNPGVRPKVLFGTHVPRAAIILL